MIKARYPRLNFQKIKDKKNSKRKTLLNKKNKSKYQL